MSTPPVLPPPPPDTKDWTWVLDRPCAECGLDASSVPTEDLPRLLRENADAWPPLLAGTDAAVRPAPEVWSVLEYAAHVRDVHRVFAGRVRAILTEDDPLFENWDQDVAAVEGDYAGQDPALVAVELVAAAHEVAAAYEGAGPGTWDRPGRRSNGSVFTLASLGRYHLHDVVHHLADVAR